MKKDVRFLKIQGTRCMGLDSSWNRCRRKPDEVHVIGIRTVDDDPDAPEFVRIELCARCSATVELE